jgi:hypothetical protein
MKKLFKFSVLNVGSTLAILYLIISVLKNDGGSEGWGYMALFYAFIFWILILIIDLILQVIIKNKITLNIIELFIAIIITLFLKSL